MVDSWEKNEEMAEYVFFFNVPCIFNVSIMDPDVSVELYACIWFIFIGLFSWK